MSTRTVVATRWIQTHAGCDCVTGADAELALPQHCFEHSNEWARKIRVEQVHEGERRYLWNTEFVNEAKQ